MELDRSILIRCSGEMVDDIDAAIATLAKFPHLRPISRSSFARYAIKFALYHLDAETAEPKSVCN